jgi:serine protease
MKTFGFLIFLIWVNILLSFSLHAQIVESDIGYLQEKTLIAKVKPEYRLLCFERQISHPLVVAIFNELGSGHAKKMFPLHSQPQKEFNELGFPLVDLSLIYIIEYSIDFELNYAAHLLLSSNVFEYVEPYVIPEILYIPNDPLIANQYYLSRIKAYEAWGIWKGDTNYVVGITDTGYEFNHPDLVDAVKYNYNDPIDGIDNDNDGYIDNFKGWNLGQNNNNPQYVALGHGIHVSGIAGASADNTFGIAGVGFNTKILPVKIDNAMGSLTMSYQGIVYAADHGANTINCSWGSTFGAGQFGQDIVNYATFNRNSLVVAAAGNSNNERMFYPCSYQNVLCVAGTKADDFKWENSSYYRRVDISAPGHNVYSTWANGTFVYSGGTSMASPAVAGAAALVWSYMPHLSPLQIAEHLKNTADVIDTIPSNIIYDDKLGYGRLNMYRALVDTLKPGVRLLQMDITDGNDNVFIMNDTLNISGNFINHLAQTKNLIIELKSESSFIQILDSVYVAGIINTQAQFNNSTQPFRILLLPGMPSSYDIELKFQYSDSAYTGYDYKYITVNIDFLNIAENKIQTTVTSKGNIGYNDNVNFQQGVGLRYENSASLISCSGFMIGRANNQVSDNIYGFTTLFDTDLQPVQSVAYVDPPQKGTQQIVGEFNDDGAGTQKLNVNVLHHNFAWDENDKQSFIVVEYFITNSESTDLSNVFVGYFADWELKFRSQNRAFTNAVQRFGYVFSLDSSLYAAIQLLTPGNFSHYAIDNDGQDGSVNLNDGFSSTEKFMTLSNSRTTAGNFQFGNNVSSVVSSGPYLLQPQDTLHIAFALHVAYTYTDLEQSVLSATQAWQDMQNVGVSEEENPHISVTPNPFVDEFTVCVKTDEDSHFILYDMNGKNILEFSTLSNSCYTVNTQKLPPGVYVLKSKVNDRMVRKLIKIS